MGNKADDVSRNQTGENKYFLRQFRAVADATHDTHLLGAGFDLRAAAAADANGASTASVSLMWNGI